MFYAKVFNGSFLDLKFKNNIEKLESPYFATYIQSQSKSIETVHTLNKLDLPPLIDKEWISCIKINPKYLSSSTINGILFCLAISRTVGTGTGRGPCEVHTIPLPEGGFEK